MRGYELESLAVLHEIKVLLGRLGELRRIPDDKGWKFPPSVFNRLSSTELMGFAWVLQAFPQTQKMSQCMLQGGKAPDCSTQFGRPDEVPGDLPPRR
jgi:hypothetical protein